MPDIEDRGIEVPQFVLGVRGSATLSDNLLHHPPGREKGALLLEGSPFIFARSDAPRSKYELAYQMRNFMRIGDDPDLALLRHNMRGVGTFALGGDNLWLDVSAFMGSINASPEGTLSVDPSSSFTNRDDFRRYTVAPWYQDQIGSAAVYRLRYELARAEGADSLTLAKWQHNASASVDGIDHGGKWNWGWRGNFQSNIYENDINRDRRFSAGTLHYRYSSSLRLSGSIEYEQIDGVRNDEGDDNGWGPAVGVQWSPNSRLNFTADIADRYYGTVGSANVTWSTARSTLGLAASKSVMTAADANLLTLNPRALSANPLGMQNSVMSSLLSRGIVLPEGIPIGRTWVTDTGVFDRRVTAFWALRGVSRTLTLSAYASVRESAADVDLGTPNPGGIRGSGTGGITTFNGEIRERGLTLGFVQTLDARTRIETTIDRRNVESPTADFENQLNQLQVSVVGNLTSDLTAFAGFRLTRQDARGNGSEYDENAIFAGVDKRF